jgi:predicted short-subunit dehydrogenase-like oxidoreductase (DUF2520 family)
MVIFGAGNVATHLSRHFFSRGCTIEAIYSRTPDRAEELAAGVGAAATSRLEEIPSLSDIYLVCLPDSGVAAISEKLPDRRGIWVHTAGALPITIFQPVHNDCGVLYPLQSLSRERQISLEDVPVLVEGSSPEVTRVLKDLASNISEKVYEADSASRLLFHLAAVFANNFSNHMVHIAGQILSREGEDSRLLVPLLRETFFKLEEMDPYAAQTGPAARGDVATVEKHLELLGKYPEWKKLYTFISRDIGRSRKK